MKTIVVSILAIALCVGLHAAVWSPERLPTNAPRARITVPAVKAARVVTDGKFSPGEWDGAFRQQIADNFEIYLMTPRISCACRH